MPLNFILTNAGKAAIISANNTGMNPVVISQIAIGSNSWTPTASATALSGEIKRIAAVGGGAVADDTIHITGTDSSSDVYAIKEVGLYTSGGILLAVYSQATAFITKAAATVALLAADLVLTGVPAGSVTVGDISFSYPPATETTKGVLQLATVQEVKDGADGTKAVCPLTLKQLTPTTVRAGIIRTATSGEVLAGSNSEAALTPSSVDAIRLFILQAIYPVGELLVTRRTSVPSSWLGFGTWQRYSEGRVLVGLNPGDSDFETVDLIGGQKRVSLSNAEIPSHSHVVNPPNTSTSSGGTHDHRIARSGVTSRNELSSNSTMAVRAVDIDNDVYDYVLGGTAGTANIGVTSDNGSHSCSKYKIALIGLG